MPRLFTGLEIPQDVAFALSLKRGGLSGARWIDVENYHITLRYIGDIDLHTARDVAECLGRCNMSRCFDARLTHLDFFGGKKPRSFYAGLQQNEEIKGLQASQERILQNLGLPPEGRKFIPHVTLARLRHTAPRDLARFMNEAMWFEPLRFEVNRFVLYSSRDSVGGGPYMIEETYEFEPQELIA